MDKQCRGTACIISVFNVTGMKPRNGTDVDCDRLKQLFEQLHFHVVVFHDEDGLSALVCYLLCWLFFCQVRRLNKDGAMVHGSWRKMIRMVDEQ